MALRLLTPLSRATAVLRYRPASRAVLAASLRLHSRAAGWPVAQRVETRWAIAARPARVGLATSSRLLAIPPPNPAPSPTPKADPPKSDVPAAAEPKKSLAQRAKDELLHYWHGSKLLATQVKISVRLSRKLLHGTKLTRREYRQLQRTAVDMLRLVPFLVFVIVPFMEFLLPVFLKLFPNMLPSTFESQSAEDERRRKLLKVRLEMARFLQETVSEVASSGSDQSEATQEFVEYFRKIRNTGELATTGDILRIARKFRDELTLDNLSRPQLVSMCRYMNMNAFGTDTFLRYQIQAQLQRLAKDDQMIMDEGVDSLSVSELQNACSSRGIRTVGVSPARLRVELQQWLDLHVTHQVPGTLLVLSRAFQLTDHAPDEKHAAEALQATLSSLPDSVVNETVLQLSEKEGTATYKQRLNVIEQQEEMIADELEQEEAEAAATLQEEQRRREAAAAAAPPEGQLPPLQGAYRGDDDEPAATLPPVPEDDVRISEEEMKQLGQVLAVLGSKDPARKAAELFNAGGESSTGASGESSGKAPPPASG